MENPASAKTGFDLKAAVLKTKAKRLKLSFFQKDNTLQIAKELLGQRLCTRIDGVLTSGLIVETEAYFGIKDRASHAFAGRRTKRNAAMYQAGGLAYIYLCYGMYPLLNIVTGLKEQPNAVLIRALEPETGLKAMFQRRRLSWQTPPPFRLTNGPGALAIALGLKPKHNQTSLLGPLLWLEETGRSLTDEEIDFSPRVGVAYAGQDALRPYRFQIKKNPWISPAKTNYGSIAPELGVKSQKYRSEKS
ncbi:MAG: DNA-3-methyladenine glycosylase [Parachlamydiales bacterium]|jgi:DNA-3-methyladenine glycosylase